MQNFKVQFVFFILLNTVAVPTAAAEVRDAVVKIFVTYNRMDHYRPWQAKGSDASTGSGFVIRGNRIITNAHVVSDNTFIQVRKESNPKKYTAHLEAIGYDCDLAVLTVEDPEFFKDVPALDFGELPNLRDTVTVVGFPRGGDKLSVTEGVVSRVEIVRYSQSNKSLLAVQIDAAINPGNSGGPVFLEGKVIGVAMQIISSSQNIGYMIPTPIINHFLTDLKDGNYDGFPTAGFEFHNTESKSLREYYQVEDKEGGVLVQRVLPFSSAHKILKEGDILLTVDDIPIGVDGTFEFRENERLLLSYLINEKQVGDEISLKFVRNGKVLTKTFRLDRFISLVVDPHFFEKPPYYIYGGFIFTVLSYDLLTSWGKRWWKKAPYNFLYYHLGSGRFNEKEKKEIVVLLEVLPDDVSVGYHRHRFKVIAKVNGQEFDSFQEFVTLLENVKGPYTIFEAENKLKIILKNENIDSLNESILQRNNIPAQSSAGVAQWLKKE